LGNLQLVQVGTGPVVEARVTVEEVLRYVDARDVNVCRKLDI